jgi:GcrA cell cycle regulator
MEATNWLPEHSAALRDLRARGMSYSDIADAINARFNTAYTRNAALGRAQRMGLGSLDRAEPSLPNQPGADRVQEIRGEPRDDVFRWPKPFVGKVDLPKLRCVETSPRHLSLIELECGDCRYPYGGDSEDEPITFCGRPRRTGSSYCEPHLGLSRDPEPSEEPVLSDAWLRAVGAG